MSTSPATDLIIADSDLPSPLSNLPTTLPSLTTSTTATRAKAVIRTYGKNPITTILTAIIPSSSTLSDTLSSSINGDIGEEEIVQETITATIKDSIPFEIHSERLKRNSSLVIPETDFDLPRTVEKVVTTVPVIAVGIDRRSRQDRIDEGEEVEEILDEGLLSCSVLVHHLKHQIPIHSSSSPLKLGGSNRRDLNSTDPTSEEDYELDQDQDATIRKLNNAFNTTSSPCPVAIGMESDASSDDDDNEGDRTLLIGKTKTVQEELEEMDALYAEEDRLEEERLKATKSISVPPTTSIASTSSLSSTVPIPITTTITATKVPSFPLPAHLAGSSSLTSLATSLPSPPSTSTGRSKSNLVRTISNSSSPPQATTNTKRRRIIDSDDEEEEEVKSIYHSRVIQDSSEIEDADEGEESKNKASTSIQPLKSKKEKLEEMAKKRAPPAIIVDAVKESQKRRSMSYSESESDGGRKGRKGSKVMEKKIKRKGELSKKDELALNSETAALIRNQPAEIIKTSRSFSKPSEIAARRIRAPVQSLRPTILPTPEHSMPKMIVLSSGTSTISDQIETSTPARPTPISQRSAPPLSSLSFSTPIASDRKLNSKPIVVKPMSEEEGEEEEEDLPDMQEIDRRRTEEKLQLEKKKKLNARKLAVAAAQAKARMSSSIKGDSDSDVEILPPPAKTTTTFPTKKPTSSQSIPATLEEALSTPRLSTHARVIRELAGAKASHIEEDVTESQLDAAAHTFGNKLGGGESRRTVPTSLKRDSMGGKVQSVVRIEKRTKEVRPTINQFEDSLWIKSRVQNAQQVLKKQIDYQQTSIRQREDNVAKEFAVFDAREVMDKVAAKKKVLEKEKLMKDEEDDAEDGDYVSQGGEEEEDDEMGSGSDGEVRLGIDDEAMESGSEVEGEEVEKNASEQEEEEEEDDEDSEVPILKRRKIQIEDDEEDVEVNVQSSDEVILPTKVLLPEMMGGGFSQFFDDDFSQQIRQGAETDGYKSIGNVKAKMADTGHELLNIDERDEDIALLESRNVFKYDTLATPQAVIAPQQYINKLGLLTQNRPANLYDYEDSSPYNIPTILDSESQGLSPTQIDDGQTPSRNPMGQALRAVNSFGFEISSRNVSVPLTAPEPTELVSTVIVETQEDDEEEEEEEEETQDIFAALPSAQPPRNAFSVLLAEKVVPVVEPIKKRTKNAFIDDQVELSDEEDTRMGAISVDEDETGMDAEDSEIVDNVAVDSKLAQEQDARADELRRNQEDQDETDAFKRAQAVADGKARANAKGLGDFDDEEFDDDNWGMANKHKAKPRADNSTLAAIAANTETASFAAAMNLDISLPDEELDHLLHEPEGLAIEKKMKKFQSRRRERHSTRAGESDEDDGAYLSATQPESEDEDESEQEEVHGSDDEEGFGRSLGQLEYDSRHTEIALTHSSSPSRAHVTKRSKAKAPRAIVRPGELFDESQYQSLYTGKGTYKAVAKDESQDNGNGVTAGAKSSVTSFIGQKERATATYGGKLEAGQHGKTTILAKESRFGFRKKNNFAT